MGARFKLLLVLGHEGMLGVAPSRLPQGSWRCACGGDGVPGGAGALGEGGVLGPVVAQLLAIKVHLQAGAVELEAGGLFK